MHVFISYSRKNKDIATHIAEQLDLRGANVFIDYKRLLAGQDWTDRLAKEIEKADVVLFLMSPISVKSKWVKAEISWAEHLGKPILPVWLDDDTSMSSFFFLARVERVDFTRWYQDQNVDEALTKLIASLDLPTEPTRETISDELASFKAADDPEPTEETESPTPEIPLGDLAEMFFTASEVADDDPERAVFLYQQVLEIDPEYMGGEIQGFVDRELKRLLPKRIQNFEEQIVHEKMKGNWRCKTSITGFKTS